MIAQDFLLSSLQVQGEVSNCKYHHSGHVYFTLKDENAAISCVMFAGNRAGLAFSMQNGDKVIVTGSVDVYEKDGSYRLYAKRIKRSGAGELYEKFLALKAELEEMGMFAPEYKKPIPAHAKRIGVVTAPTGAAIRDIQNIIRRRNPGIQIILYPAFVQGDQAKESISEGIRVLDKAGVDIIIAGRGGGSLEDLWAFNEEEVARAIFNCKTPVISAVGHETDFTIADFVADLRAPTPSAAAELASENIFETIERINALERRISFSMSRSVELAKSRTEQLLRRIEAYRPDRIISGYRERLKYYETLISSYAEKTLRENKYRLRLLAGRLDELSPLKRLSAGFAYVSLASGESIRSAGQVNIGDAVDISLKDGMIHTSVNDIEKKEVLSDE
jgi:exodeoxyribonuclease VII large subunit